MSYVFKCAYFSFNFNKISDEASAQIHNENTLKHNSNMCTLNLVYYKD
jgi:hypothetical protein